MSTLCSITYGDVAEGLTKNEPPMRLDLFRGKAGVEYYTFLGKYATETLKVYLNDAKARGLTFNNNTPLFLKGSETNHVQSMLKELAIKSGFIDKNSNGKDFNPLGPHALRESFGSIMTRKGVPDAIVDFWLGHEIGEMAEAYKSAKFEDVKQMYAERERFISITTNGDIEQKLRAEIDEKSKQLQTLVNGLVSENMQLKSRVEKLEKDGQLWFDAANRMPKFIDQFTDEDLEELRFLKEQRERAEAEESRQKEESEIDAQLKAERKLPHKC